MLITDQEADFLIESYDSAAPEQQVQIRERLTEYRDFQQAQLAKAREQEGQRVRSFYSDLETLGGNWSEQMQQSLGPFQTDPQKDRAAWANVGFLAHVTGKIRREIAPIYEVLRGQYSRDNFQGQELDDLGFYNAVKGKFEQQQAEASLTIQRDGMATNEALLAAIEGRDPSPDSAFAQWQSMNKGKTDPRKELGDFLAFRDSFNRSYQLGRDNRDLFVELQTMLAKGTKAINAGAGLAQEAAARLIEAEPEVRKAFMQSLVAWAAHNSPADPQGAANQTAELFRNMGRAYMQGADALRPSTFARIASELGAAKLLKDIQEGRPVYMDGQNVVGEDVAFQTDEGQAAPPKALPLATAEQRQEAEAKLKKQVGIFQLARELEAAAKETFAPIKPVVGYIPDAVEKGMVGLAGSVPQMTAAMVPYVGTAAMSASVIGQRFDEYRLKNPTMSVEIAATLALVSGSIEAVIEKFQVNALLGKTPLTSRLLAGLTSPTTNTLKAFGIKTVGGIIEQNLQEGLQDLTPVVVQAIGSQISQEVPGVNWAEEWKQFGGTRLETFFAVLPLALLGAGASSARESRFVFAAIQNPTLMVEAGITQEKAQEIAALPEAERENAFRLAWAERTPETIKAGLASAEQRLAAQQAYQQSPAAPQLEYTGEQWRLVEPDGSVSATFQTAEQAEIAINDRMAWEANGNAQAVRDLVGWFAAKDTGRKWEVIPTVRTLDQETTASPEVVAEQMRLAGYAAGTSPSAVQVFGSNTVEVQEGLMRAVNRVFLGASPLDVVEEEVHYQFKRELAAGTVTRAQAEAALRSFLGGNAPVNFTDTQLHEGVAAMGRAYFAGNVRKIDTLPTSVRGFFARMGAFFRAAFQQAAQMLKLKKEGKLDADWEAFLARAVGMDADLQQNKATVKAAGELVGAGVEGVSFSLKPAAYAEQLAQQMDRLKSTPEARLKIYEAAKKKLREIVTKNREAIAAIDTESGNTDERVAQAKAAHDTELALLAQEEQEALAAAADDKQRNGIRLGYGSKRAAADRRLRAELDKITGKAVTEARTIQALAELNAILSAFPAEVRGKVGGFVQLAQLKTDKGRGRFISERIERAEAELEKLLKKEYFGQLAKVLESGQPKGKAGEKAKGKLGAWAHGWFAEASRIAGLSEVDLEKEEAYVEKKLSGAEEITPADIAELNRKFDGIKTEEQARAMLEVMQHLLTTFGDIKNRTSSEISTALDAARSMFQRGRLDWHARMLDRAAKREQLREQLISDAGGPGTKDLIARREEADKKLGRTAKRVLLDIGNDWQQTISQIFGQGSTTHSWAEKLARESANKEQDSMAQRSQRFTEFMRSIFPGSIRKRVEAMARLAERKEVKVGGSTLFLSELEAVHYTMLWADPSSREWLTEHGLGAPQQAALEAMLSPEAVKIRGWLTQEYDAQYDYINGVYKRIYGVNLPRVDNYAPRLVDHGGNVQEMALSPEQMQGGLQSGFTKRRVQKPGQPPLQVDALSAYWQNAHQVEHWANWAEAMGDLRGVFFNSDSLRSIKANAGEAMAGNVGEWLRIFDRGGVENARGQEFLRRFLQSTSDTALLLKLGTILKQIPAAYSSAAVIGLPQWLASASRVLTGRAAISWAQMIQSDVIQRRMANYSLEMRQAMAGHRGVLSEALKKAQALGADPRAADVLLHAARNTLGFADAIFTGLGAAVIYDNAHREALRLNMSQDAAHAHAMEETSRIVAETAQPDSIDRKSLFELRLGLAGKMLFMFQSANRQAFQITKLAWEQGRKGDAVKAMSVYWVANGIVLQTIGNLVRFATSDDDWDEVWEIEDFARSMAMGPLSGAMFIGPVLDAVSATLSKGYEPRIASPAAEVKKLKNSINAVFGDKDFDPRDMGNLTQSLSIILGGRAAAMGVAWNAAKQALGFGAAVMPGDQQPSRKR